MSPTDRFNVSGVAPLSPSQRPESPQRLVRDLAWQPQPPPRDAVLAAPVPRTPLRSSSSFDSELRDMTVNEAHQQLQKVRRQSLRGSRRANSTSPTRQANTTARRQREVAQGLRRNVSTSAERAPSPEHRGGSGASVGGSPRAPSPVQTLQAAGRFVPPLRLGSQDRDDAHSQASIAVMGSSSHSLSSYAESVEQVRRHLDKETVV
jgi:hypothetical protein